MMYSENLAVNFFVFRIPSPYSIPQLTRFKAVLNCYLEISACVNIFDLNLEERFSG